MAAASSLLRPRSLIRFLVRKPSTPPPLPAMASRDLRRLLDGAALVAREAARRASAPDVLRSALLAATDLAGLTRGTPRTPRPTPPLGPHHPAAAAAAGEARASVVYFSHDDAGPVSPPRRPPQDPPLEQRPPARESPHPAQAKEITEAGVAAAVGAAEPEPVAVARPPDGEAAGRSPAPSPSPSPVVRVEKRRRPRERRVPSTPFTRALGSVCHTMHRFEQGEMRIRLFVKLRIEQCVNRVVFFAKFVPAKLRFAGLGAGLAWGTLQESARRVVYGRPADADGKRSAMSPFLSDQNAERIALALCRMRGAALKVGQMLSIQDESLVPPPVVSPI